MGREKSVSIKIIGKADSAVAAFNRVRQESESTFPEMAQDIDQAKKAQQRLATAFETLGVRSLRDVQREVYQAEKAYKELKRSGTVSAKDLARAKRGLIQKTRELRRETSLYDRALGGLSGKVKAIIGAYLGYQGIRALVGATVKASNDASSANFNLQASVQAANREFGNVGGMERWNKTARGLSEEMKIYSEASVKNAISRTIDMTKRLGLNAEQMENVIRLSADLSAGRTDLEGGIERVTAALRGEAESAEFLGLTLNENYIKGWYEAHGAHETAWKDLTDLEKAQVRYQVLLEQASPMAGRAAESINTMSGAWQYLTSQIDNAIANNSDVQKTIVEVGNAIKANAPAIAELIGDLAEVLGEVAQFVIENKGLVTSLVASGGVLYAVSSVVGMVGNLTGGLGLMRGELGLGTTALKGFGAAAVIAFSTTMVVKATQEYIAMREAIEQAEKAQNRMLKTTERVKGKNVADKDVAIPQTLSGLGDQGLADLRARLARAKAYWTAELNELSVQAKETSFFGGLTDEAEQAVQESYRVESRLREITQALGQVQVKIKANTAPVVPDTSKVTAGLEKTTGQLAEVSTAQKEAAGTAKDFANDQKAAGDATAAAMERAADSTWKLVEAVRQLKKEKGSIPTDFRGSNHGGSFNVASFVAEIEAAERTE